MGDFLDSVQLPDLIKGVNARGETTVKTENLTFNDCSQRKVIEKLGELLPYISISVFPQAFIIKSVSTLIAVK